MNFSTFRQDTANTLTEPMFMGNSVNGALRPTTPPHI